MSKNLAVMLGKSEKLMADSLSKLEEKAGFPSHDVRLLAELSQAYRVKIRELGLDPNDTTGEELHQALVSRFGADSAKLDSALGIANGLSADRKIAKAIQAVERLTKGWESWKLKPAAAKQLLKTQPPKRTMKYLHYRSVDSLLKRQELGALSVYIRLLETPAWQKSIAAKVAKLDNSCFELKSLELLKIKADSTDRLVVSSPYGAAAAIVDCPSSRQASALTLIVMLTDEINGLGTHKLRIGDINPCLQWWTDTGHLLAWNGGQPVSFNLHDVALAHTHGLLFDDRQTNHAARSLWAELTSRYSQQLAELPKEVSAVEKSLTGQLTKLTLPVHDLAFEYSEA